MNDQNKRVEHTETGYPSSVDWKVTHMRVKEHLLETVALMQMGYDPRAGAETDNGDPHGQRCRDHVEKVLKAVDELPDDQRQLIACRYSWEEERTDKDVWGILNISPATYYRWKRAAFCRLGAALGLITEKVDTTNSPASA